MFIRSERLFLRPGWSEDIQTLAALGCAYRREGSAHYPHFVITLPGDRGAQVIGVGGLHRRGRGVAVRAAIAQQFRGRGFRAEARATLAGLARAIGHSVIDDDDPPGDGQAAEARMLQAA